MEKNKRQYDKEFKKETVDYYLTSGKSGKEVARDLGIPYSNLKRWHTQYKKRGEFAFPGHGKENLTPPEERLRKLQKELNDITMEPDLLKKALVIFTKKP